MAASLPPSGSLRRPTVGWTVADQDIVRKRAMAGLVALCLIFGLLLGRLWYLQVVRGAAYLSQAQRNRTAKVPLPAPRGLITDRDGVVLATSKAQHSVAVVRGALPSQASHGAERTKILGSLAFLLGTTATDIEAQLEEARVERGSRPFDPVVIARGINLPTITLIQENKPRLGSAVIVADDLKRLYPRGALAGHVLGYTGLVTKRDLERSRENSTLRQLASDDVLGKNGIEREYDAILAGTPGAEEWDVDSRGRPLRPRGRVREMPGGTLQLSLSLKLQQAAENALAKARNNGSVAVVDPRNGEVLALASRPGYDPNIFSEPRKSFSAKYRKLVAAPGHPFLNRPVVSRFSPGSTFKMITAAAGLQRGVIDPGWTVNCNGGMKLGRWFGCWSNHGGGINLKTAIAKSCNVYFYQLSLKLGNPESSGPHYLAEVARDFGLGHAAGLDLPSGSAGLVPDPAWRKEVNQARPDLARWFPGNTLNMSIGQGDVLATPLQMAVMTAAFANGGTVWRPHLLRKHVAANGQKVTTVRPSGRRVKIAPAHMELIRQGMRQVVVAGTGKGANLPQVEVAGKTGSAEDDNHGLPHAWWVCFAPYEKPTIAICVMVENAGHGSDNAVPIARKILEAAFPGAEKPLP